MVDFKRRKRGTEAQKGQVFPTEKSKREIMNELKRSIEEARQARSAEAARAGMQKSSELLREHARMLGDEAVRARGEDVERIVERQKSLEEVNAELARARVEYDRLVAEKLHQHQSDIVERLEQKAEEERRDEALRILDQKIEAVRKKREEEQR
jgi:hypothetical protein